MLILAVTGAAAALGLLLYGVLSEAEEKATIRASLRQLGTYEVENVRDTELLTPFRERAIAPFLGRVTDLGRRLTPVESARRKLILSGRASPDALDRFLAMRVLFLALIPVWFVLVFFFLPVKGTAAFAVFGLLAATSFLGPEAILNRRVAERQYKIRVKLPDILDLLVISVEAGLGFEQALDRTVNAVPGPLSEEFSRMLGETRAGSTRADALRAMEQRVHVQELRSFVLAILQADTFGVSIGRVLRAQADEMRIKRRQMAQERAMKAPIKMLVPMVFCIFPAIFVITLGPAVINILKNFK